MDKSDHTDRIRRSVSQVMDDGVQETLRTLIHVDTKLGGLGRDGGVTHFIQRRRHLKDGFRAACEAAARQLCEIDQESAVSHVELLDAAIQDGQVCIQEHFDRVRISAKAYGDPFEGQSEALQVDLAEVRSVTINNLHLGIVGGQSVKRAKGDTNVDIRGASGQFAVGSRINQAIGGNQTIGLDVQGVLAALAALRKAASAANLSQEKRDEFEDAVVTVQREAESNPPNVSRLGRYANKLLSLATDFGVDLSAHFAAIEILKQLASGG